MYDRILGGLIGAGAGDAMGAATEARTTEQILAYFGHEVTDFEKPPMDTFGAGNEPGQLTDDFSSAYFVAKHIVENSGVVTAEAVQNALIEWSEHAVFLDRFAGPTTRLAIRRYKGEKIEKSGGVELVTRQATNGAAMKISPIGLLNAGNIDQAIRDAITVTMVTHDNYLALSGACAVAAAVSRAVMEDADVYNILQAGLYGAKEGERIGAGLHVAEAIPSAFGFFAANDGDAMGSIIGAVNVGYDTDTIATMSGAIAGAYRGAKAYPEHFLPTLEQANHLEIAKLAEDLTAIATKRLEQRGMRKREEGGCDE